MELKIERRQDGQLWAVRDGEVARVRVSRCFPWSEPTRYLSLRDDDEQEVGLIDNLDELDPDSREALAGALVEAGFVLEITAIDSLQRDFEIRVWKVQTRQGPRTFQTKLDDWPRALPGDGLLIRDVAGDLFHLPDPHGLDPKSQKILWAFVD